MICLLISYVNKHIQNPCVHVTAEAESSEARTPRFPNSKEAKKALSRYYEAVQDLGNDHSSNKEKLWQLQTQCTDQNILNQSSLPSSGAGDGDIQAAGGNGWRDDIPAASSIQAYPKPNKTTSQLLRKYSNTGSTSIFYFFQADNRGTSNDSRLCKGLPVQCHSTRTSHHRKNRWQQTGQRTQKQKEIQQAESKGSKESKAWWRGGGGRRRVARLSKFLKTNNR